MPFIWNDDQIKVLENSVDFDKSQYVIVRKLFVQFKEHIKDIGEEWIMETFQKYGNIELIEVFSKENNTKWAYLTFIRDDEAYLALTEAIKSIEIERIVPADTWCQPSSLSSGPTPTQDTIKEILNEFEAANIEERSNDVSRLLRQLISLSLRSNSESFKETLNNRILPSAKKFDFELGDSDNEKRISLNEARLILRCVGPYICDLGLHFKMDKYPNNIKRYLFKICQYIGPNLTKIRLKFFPTNQDCLLQLQPLLQRIECLYLQTSNYDFDNDIDLQLYCPHLKTLKISMNLKGELLSKKEWPKLERFSNLHNQFMEERLVLDFMKNNPQLKYLKIEANDSNNLMKQIPKLEKLCLYQGYPDICADNLAHLTEMKHLKKLKLMYMEPDEFNGILNCLPKFKQLQELKLHVFYDGIDSADLDDIYCPNLESIIVLAQELTQLECFHIRYCHIDSETLYNFVRNAKMLKYIGIYRCGLEITDLILEDIDKIRQAVSPTLMVLYADKIHPELNKESREVGHFMRVLIIRQVESPEWTLDTGHWTSL